MSVKSLMTPTEHIIYRIGTATIWYSWPAGWVEWVCRCWMCDGSFTVLPDYQRFPRWAVELKVTQPSGWQSANMSLMQQHAATHKTMSFLLLQILVCFGPRVHASAVKYANEDIENQITSNLRCICNCICKYLRICRPFATQCASLPQGWLRRVPSSEIPRM